MTDSEIKYMRRAIQLAKLGAGGVSPNPMVGAVLVANGKIIGEGYHRKFGEGHAEVNAIASVRDKELLSQSTIYVTLEPCSHYGKTPPCSKLIIDSKIPRVVIGSLDPFIKVSGRGVKMLRDAGVEVEVGVLENECKALNEKFMTAHSTGRPYVMLKWAQSSDGFIDSDRTDRGQQVVISNPLTTTLTHRQRSLFDAILVGAGTVKTDNPSLSVRHYAGKSPIRILLDRQLSSPKDSLLFTDGKKTIVYNDKKASTEGSVEYVLNDCTSLTDILSDIYSRGITSLMVEGGENVLNQFLEAELWDTARVEIGQKTILKGINAPKIKGIITNQFIFEKNKIFLFSKFVKNK